MPLAVASVQSPAGVALAGKFGAAVLTITTPRDPSSAFWGRFLIHDGTMC